MARLPIDFTHERFTSFYWLASATFSIAGQSFATLAGAWFHVLAEHLRALNDRLDCVALPATARRAVGS